MADIVTVQKRSQMMAGIRGKDTKPEILLRKLYHSAGYRFRVHRVDLPGKPDLVLAKYGAAVFVNGCFWHGHCECSKFRLPKSNTAFWAEKIAANRFRDERNLEIIAALGWRVLVVWECSLSGAQRLNRDELLRESRNFLHSSQAYAEIRGN